MKTINVPQDDAGFLKKGKVRDLCYALDENGNYITVHSIGWEPKNEAIRQAWNEINSQLVTIINEIKDKKVSPLKFFMVKNLMNIKMLSKYSGFPKWKIRKHMKHEAFKNLNQETLEIYSKVFNVELCQLNNLSLTNLCQAANAN